MKSVPLSTFVLGGALVSIATVYSTDLAARDKSSQGASVSAGGVSVSAGPGGASVSAGGTSVSADRGGASVSAGGGSVSAGGGSVSADRGGASVSGGGSSVSADRGGASVSAEGSDADVGGVDTGAPSMQAGRQVGDRSYDSLGGWFSDLRSSWFGGKSKVSDEMKTTTTNYSSIQSTETSGSGRTQNNRVVQENSATVIGTDGGSATSKIIKQKNVNVTEQRN
jgi:hypothetical protein